MFSKGGIRYCYARFSWLEGRFLLVSYVVSCALFGEVSLGGCLHVLNAVTGMGSWANFIDSVAWAKLSRWLHCQCGNGKWRGCRCSYRYSVLYSRQHLFLFINLYNFSCDKDWHPALQMCTLHVWPHLEINSSCLCVCAQMHLQAVHLSTYK